MKIGPWYIRVSRRNPDHEHKITIVAAQVVDMPAPGGSIVKMTAVLMRCEECNHPQSATLNGAWSTEQVRGEVGSAIDALTRPTVVIAK